jgi:hypothetical protein
MAAQQALRQHLVAARVAWVGLVHASAAFEDSLSAWLTAAYYPEEFRFDDLFLYPGQN